MFVPSRDNKWANTSTIGSRAIWRRKAIRKIAWWMTLNQFKTWNKYSISQNLKVDNYTIRHLKSTHKIWSKRKRWSKSKIYWMNFMNKNSFLITKSQVSLIRYCTRKQVKYLDRSTKQCFLERMIIIQVKCWWKTK